ncbi:MAG: hypothetical protein LUP97_02615 [Methanoregula sp.]|nr:hypothetical protein [Methanoregula sp.]
MGGIGGTRADCKYGFSTCVTSMVQASRGIMIEGFFGQGAQKSDRDLDRLSGQDDLAGARIG